MTPEFREVGLWLSTICLLPVYKVRVDRVKCFLVCFVNGTNVRRISADFETRPWGVPTQRVADMPTKRPSGGDLPHSIRIVAKRTGLSPHVIRVWEKRYGTVKPHRTATNRRLYSTADVERLVLLRRATNAGHGIGNIANLPIQQLEALVSAESPGSERYSGRESVTSTVQAPAAVVDAVYGAVLAMDPEAIEQLLDRAAVALGQVRLLSDVVVPLVTRIGSAWQAGDLKVAHEHIASAAIRTYLGHMARPASLHPGAPAILVTTPAGQMHEVGAALAAAAAASQGWRVVFAGAAMPATEIAAAAIQNRVRVVALSIVYPSDDPGLGPELVRLRRVLPVEIALIIGGRAAGGYRAELEKIRALCAQTLDAFLQELARLRE